MHRHGAALATLLVLGLSACRGSERPSAAPGGLRVVSLHDVTTEIVIALGAGKRLVGVTEPVDATPELRGAIADVPRVGEAETLLSVQPDLVLGLEIVRQKSPELVSDLERRKKSVYLPSLATLDDVDTMIREVGRRLGLAEAGERLAARLREQVGPSAGRGGEPTRVFVYDCCDPPFTAANKTVLSDLIERAGGHNVFADIESGWTHVSWEEVIARRPELVVIDAYGDGKQREVGSKVEALRAMRQLRDLPTTVIPLRYSLGGLGVADGAAILRAAMGGHT